MKRLLLFALLLGAVPAIFAQTPVALIREISGTVELKTPGSENWTAAKAGGSIEKSTIISTGFKSNALLEIGNSTLIVRPLTRLSLEELMSREEVETINVGLRTGRIQVSVKPPAGSRTEMSVQTPVATASVRGTDFSMDPVNIQVREGNVRLEYSGGDTASRPVMVGAGQKARVSSDTRRAANPHEVAILDRNLPELPGGISEVGARMNLPMGALVINVTLEEIEWE